MSVHVTPFLMFQGGAEEAVELYLSAFPGSQRADAVYRAQDGSAVAGRLQRATLIIGEQRIKIFDSEPVHAFTFTPSFSLFVDFDTERELDDAHRLLSAGGTALMPPGNYGFSQKFAWINDRFGVSWQLNLP
jgi:predicted 3-demethylubiquinone-9 3-methyltransferase (glyoxalase superfamily)